MTAYAKVIGTGGYLPAEIKTNEDISRTVDTSDSWIFERTGIKSRRIAAKDETASSMAEIAARQAIDMADIDPKDIDLIIVALQSQKAGAIMQSWVDTIFYGF
jgi:3-oxoacyl-[acyl-carrier-protein] synthase-3